MGVARYSSGAAAGRAGGGVLSYTCYIAIRPVLVRSGVSVSAILASNSEWFLRSRLELDMFTEEAIFRHYR